MSRRLLSLIRFAALALALALVLVGTSSSVRAADTTNYYMGHSVFGYSGYSPGGTIDINARPIDAEVRLDGVLLGVANDLQAVPVDAHTGTHTLTVSAPGYESVVVVTYVVQDWTTRVRLSLIPARVRPH